FETLLYYLQNILQNRPVLLLEIATSLADEVTRLESMAAPTSLDSQLLYQHRQKGHPYYDELTETHYLETYSRIHSTVMGVDRKGKIRIFGLRNHAYEAPLLSLLDDPKTVKELVNETMWGVRLKENTLNAILNHINPMFQQNEKGQWSTAWDSQALSNELQRVISLHFDEVAERNRAWRGYPYEKEKSKYKLPWQSEWRTNVLESNRILSRERHADEVAQRLIYRLQKGMEIMGKSLADVKVLACVTSPAMLLANYIHRWWPPQYDRPAVSDLGYYVMLSHPKELPSIVKSGGIVIVHDILDRGAISGKLYNVLLQQHQDILCLLSFIQLVSQLKGTEVAPIESGWTPEPGEGKYDFLPKHSMIWVKRPEKCPAPTAEESDKNTFWIEPRTLRPVRYLTLRRQFEPGKDKDLDRRNRYLKRFDHSTDGCLFAAGHYVYGPRHFSVSVDVQKTLNGEIGDEIALWLADICGNPGGRQPQEWENKEGKKLTGDVTAVLMPLHSQIHYIWPKVEKILVQRGRRQLTYLLDATLFAGSGPAYRIPIQFQGQIAAAVKESVEAFKKGKS
ncbi:MAG: hypothetical protein GY757_04690, partial [bacterium]|nr:hypothetical protein [bacterium]